MLAGWGPSYVSPLETSYVSHLWTHHTCRCPNVAIIGACLLQRQPIFLQPCPTLRLPSYSIRTVVVNIRKCPKNRDSPTYEQIQLLVGAGEGPPLAWGHQASARGRIRGVQFVQFKSSTAFVNNCRRLSILATLSGVMACHPSRPKIFTHPVVYIPILMKQALINDWHKRSRPFKVAEVNQLDRSNAGLK